MIGHAAAVLAVTVQVAAPPRTCLSLAEAGAGVAVLLPDIVEVVSRSCERHLSADAYLRTNGAELAARWRTESVPHRAATLEAVARMRNAVRNSVAGEPQPPISAADAEAEVPQIMQRFSAAADANLNLENYKLASELFESIAPFPAKNVSQFVRSILGISLALTPGESDGYSPICRQ